MFFQVVTPQKVGSVYIYDQPVTGHQDYDVPPSRYFPVDENMSPTAGVSPQPPYQSPIPQHRQPYQTPISRDVPLTREQMSGKPKGPKPDELYDTPQALQGGEIPGLPTYDVLPMSRVSNVSMLSTGSTISSSMSSQSIPLGSAPPSSCGSTRSSYDISAHDLYDVPPPPKTLGTFSPQDRRSVEMLEIYDSPLKHTEVTLMDIKNSQHGSRALSGIQSPLSEPNSDLYDTPRHDVISGVSALYDVPSGQQMVDDLYDVPSNNAPTVCGRMSEGRVNKGIVQGLQTARLSDQSSLYDIPPQVTRDSAISIQSDLSSGAGDLANRLSSSSIDSKSSDLTRYEELPLDLDSAMELLVKLQQDVQSTTSKLLSFVSSTWRQKQNLEPKLFEIKQSCYNVKNAIKEFVDFGQGSLANSAKSNDTQLAKKLAKQLMPLQDAHNNICRRMKNLDTLNWHIAKLSETVQDPFHDDLGEIVSLVKDVPYAVRTLASFIQGNSVLLFQRSGQIAAKDNTQMDLPVYSQPNKPKPPPTKPKPKLPQAHQSTQASNTVNIQEKSPSENIENRNSSIQERPLPKPPTPTEKSTPNISGDTRPLSSDSGIQPLEKGIEQPVIYDIPKSQCESDIYANDSQAWLDYDYVALDTKHKAENRISCQSVHSEESTGVSINNVNNDKSGGEEANRSGALVEDKSLSNGGDMNKTPASVLHNQEALGSSGSNMQDIGLSPKFKERLERLQQKGIASVSVPPNNADRINTDASNYIAPNKLPRINLEDNDKQILLFYARQIENHSLFLINATDAFFQSIEYNQPPKIFIAHSKFVVLAAHKLVYIADTLQRNVTNEDVRSKIMACANYLCDCLKTTVTSTKIAALQYPSVQAVQDMVDKVVDVSHSANELKLVISQASVL